MKTSFILPVLLLAGTAQAQTNVLKVDIFQPISNTLALSFEHKLNETSSFQIGLAGTFGYKEDTYISFVTPYDGVSTSGFAITPEYRFYLSEKHPALEGFYVAPFLRYQYLSQTGPSSTGSSYSASLNSLGLGLTVGRHWIFKHRFSLDLFAGPGYTFVEVSSDQPGYTPNQSDFVGYYDNNYDLRGGVTFGLAF